MYTCDCISDTLHESVIEVYTCDCISDTLHESVKCIRVIV